MTRRNPLLATLLAALLAASCGTKTGQTETTPTLRHVYAAIDLLSRTSLVS